MATRIGLISDTHGLLRPEALAALAGSDGIVHAGDIGDAAILERLARIAPVVAVRGNNDTAAWADALPLAHTWRVEDVTLHLLHDLKQLDQRLIAERGAQVVIAGHSHKPLVQRRDGLLCVNPGSAGPRRFKLPVSVGALHIDGAQVDAELTTLDIAPPARRR
jgi:hypothetical protein